VKKNKNRIAELETKHKVDEELKAKLREERKERIQKLINNRSQELKERNKEADKRIKEVLSRTPLYKKLEESYNLPILPFDKASYKNPNLIHDAEKEKEVLAKIKEEHKPIRRNEIEKFAKHWRRLYKQKIKQLREIREKSLTDKNDSFDPEKYKTKGQVKYLEHLKLQKLEAQSEERKKLELVKRRNQFSKMINLVHKPKISKKKKKEIELRLMLKNNTSKQDIIESL